MTHASHGHKGHIERAAINTPVRPTPLNWPCTWWTTPLGRMRPPINIQYSPSMTPFLAPQKISTSECYASEGDRDGQNNGGGDVHLDILLFLFCFMDEIFIWCMYFICVHDTQCILILYKF